MERVRELDELMIAVAKIRDLKKGFLTNFYLDIQKHSLWINKGVVFCERIEDTLFIVKTNRTFWNVFFCSPNYDELAMSLEAFNSRHGDMTLMYDVVGNIKMQNEYGGVFRARMTEYCSLVRMSKISGGQEFYQSEEVLPATRLQAQELRDILITYFDEKTEQIPFLEEIVTLIERGNVFVYMLENKIVGFVILEKNVSTLYLRYWFVHPDFRNLKIGSKLLNQFFYCGRECKRKQLWVIRTNDNAIVRYEHYGFRPEDLYDIVYTNREIKYQ